MDKNAHRMTVEIANLNNEIRFLKIEIVNIKNLLQKILCILEKDSEPYTLCDYLETS